jgi:hypothetical protein
VRFAVRWHDGQGECRCIDLVLLGALQLYLRAVFAWSIVASRAPRATRACKQANAAAAIETTAPPRGRNGAHPAASMVPKMEITVWIRGRRHHRTWPLIR